jgi:alkanesulfonate monooxygenase SsuD/methylene tetrahydromethanopterin reductase-like flavin-dependent oxidoreductase (luciferase family)
MKIGIGLPTTLPNVPGSLILDWAKQTEKGPFSSLGVIDRVVYSNYEPLATLAAVAGVTQRLRLVTAILLAPLRTTTLLAKQSASLDALSGGRLTLGLGVGAREDDFVATAAAFHTRGKRLEKQLDLMTRLWSGQAFSEEVGPIGPQPLQTGGPEVLIGGHSAVAIERVGRWGHGYIDGAGAPYTTNQHFRLAEENWNKVGKTGKPRLVGCAYFGLGSGAAERMQAYLGNYYGPYAQWVAGGAFSTEEAVKQALQAFADIGTDELLLFPCIPELDQLDRLAQLVGG